MSDSVRPHRRQPMRHPCPWDSPGKNTGVGCHFLLQCMKVKSESEVTQSCPTPSNPRDCSPPGSSVHGIFQARELEWVTSALSNGGKTGLRVTSFSGNITHLEPKCPTLKSGIPQPISFGDLREFTAPLSLSFLSCCSCSVAKLCPTLCDPVNCSTPGFPVLHYLSEFAQTHVH